ncbi:hypothetical protein AKJ16_DCAP27700, partial [Drosera capensis]
RNKQPFSRPYSNSSLPSPNNSTRYPNTTKIPPQPAKTTTFVNYADLKAKGLCFKCKEKYTIGHKCKDKLQLIEADSENKEEDELEQEMNIDMDEPEAEEAGMEVSMQALSNNSLQNTLKIKGTAGNHSLIILIDSGSTASFIDSSIAQEVECSVIETAPLKDVGLWLEEINLGGYRQIFKENGVNGEYLEGMSMFTTEQILRFIRRCHMKWGDFITLCKELRRIKVACLKGEQRIRRPWWAPSCLS